MLINSLFFQVHIFKDISITTDIDIIAISITECKDIDISITVDIDIRIIIEMFTMEYIEISLIFSSTNCREIF